MQRNFIYFSFLLILLPLQALSQKRFTGGILLQPDLNFLKVTKADVPEKYKEKGQPRLGYSGGIFIQYNLNDKLFLRSGILYQQSHFTYRVNGLIFQTDILNGTVSALEYRYAITSMGIPVDIAYKFPLKKENTTCYLGASAILNMALGTKKEGEIIHQTIPNNLLTAQKDNLKASVLSFGIFTGIEFPLNNSVALAIEPNLRLTPNQINIISESVESNLQWQTGLGLHLRWR